MVTDDFFNGLLDFYLLYYKVVTDIGIFDARIVSDKGVRSQFKQTSEFFLPRFLTSL